MKAQHNKDVSRLEDLIHNKINADEMCDLQGDVKKSENGDTENSSQKSDPLFNDWKPIGEWQ